MGRYTVFRVRQFFEQLHFNEMSQYLQLLWIFYVFWGAVIDALAIQHFVSWYHWVTEQFTVLEIAPIFLLYGVIVFLIPFGFSWFFTRRKPELRIVPPLFIQLIAAGLLLFFVYNSLIAATEYFAILLYAAYAGLIQDGAFIYAIGKDVTSNDIIRCSFIVHSNINKIEEIVRSKQFHNLFGYSTIVKTTSMYPNLKFKSTSGRNFEVLLELKTTGEKDETILNLAFYQEERYGIKHVETTGDLYRFAETRSKGIADYFHNYYSIKVDEASKENADSLANYIMDELQGALTRFQEMTTENRALIVLTISLFIVGAGLCFVYFDAGVLILITAIGLAADTVNRNRR